MKRHTKLFEEFTEKPGLWGIFPEGDHGLFGLYDTEAEAIAARRDIKDYYESEYRLTFDATVDQVFPGIDFATDAMLFQHATSVDFDELADEWPGQPGVVMVKKLLAHGADPFADDADEGHPASFETQEELDEWLRDQKHNEHTWNRSSKAKKLFGI